MVMARRSPGPRTPGPAPPFLTKSDDDPISFTLVRNEADCIRWSPSCRPVGSSRELLGGEMAGKDVYNALLPRGLSLNHNFLSAVRLSCDPPV
jgi:hypothetical protein